MINFDDNDKNGAATTAACMQMHAQRDKQE